MYLCVDMGKPVVQLLDADRHWAVAAMSNPEDIEIIVTDERPGESFRRVDVGNNPQLTASKDLRRIRSSGQQQVSTI